MESGDLCVDDVTLQRLVGQMVQQTTIPFHGEPAEGIQVMGVLETRNLDFDHVLLLSCNEGNLPRGVNDSSFIPHSIRKAYELTTVENKVSIYAYYFHRLLQRARDVTILYNSATEDGQRGEMSRFMLQLLVESPHAIARHTLQSGQTATRWQPQPIAKTASVQAVMQQTTRLSPSGINRYQRCPLQFYYCYVADLREADQPEDEQELDNRIFGNIFHDAAEIIYRQLPRQITRELLGHLLKTRVEIERAVDEAFRRHLPYAVRSGLHLINREVIVHYLRQLLEIDQRLAPFTILGLEVDVFRELPILSPLLCQAECGVANPSHPSPLKITISVPDGEEIAKRTFNPRLGIEGGISIIGVSGIVKPFSEEAFIDSIRKCVQVALASGTDRIVINSGGKSERFVKALYPTLPQQAFVEYGNYIGETLRIIADLSLLTSHHSPLPVTLGVMLGKAVKLAAGNLDTHSRKTTMDKAFIQQMLQEAGISIDISDMTLARELWERIPKDKQTEFACTVIRHCEEHCKPLLPNGQLTILLIDDDGTIHSL